MGQEIIYQWIADGENIEISSTPVDDIIELTNGIAKLVNGFAAVNTKYAGMPVLLTRNQAISTAIGNLYVDLDYTIEAQSFTIRSTNSSDNGEVYWQIII